MRLPRGLLGILLITCGGTLAGAEMSGLLVLGHEVRSLKLCGDARVFWVQMPAALRQQLDTEYRRLATRPYEAVYVELEGEYGAHPASGFAADYDGTIEVRAIHEVRSVSRDGAEACGAGQPVVTPGPAAAEEAAIRVFVCDEQTTHTVHTAEPRIRFDLDRLDAGGLQGSPDGLRALHYEYCIPDRADAIREVAATDPTLQIQRGSPGRVGCGEGELLCLGHTHQLDHREVLERLACLPFVAEIHEAFFE